jgi:hypothetical protein
MIMPASGPLNALKPIVEDVPSSGPFLASGCGLQLLDHASEIRRIDMLGCPLGSEPAPLALASLGPVGEFTLNCQTMNGNTDSDLA